MAVQWRPLRVRVLGLIRVLPRFGEDVGHWMDCPVTSDEAGAKPQAISHLAHQALELQPSTSTLHAFQNRDVLGTIANLLLQNCSATRLYTFNNVGAVPRAIRCDLIP
jgi:hypothetical protein